MKRIKEDLCNRFEILQSSDQLSKYSIDNSILIFDKLSKYSTFEINNEALEAFFTHFALSVERFRKNEMLQQLDISIKQELINNKNYNEYAKIVQHMQNDINIRFNEPEEIMIILHLCNLFSN